MKKYIGLTLEQYNALREEEMKEVKTKEAPTHVENLITEYGYGWETKVL
jgi:cupin superfamily acireductone dioxygenase involved in methionine salvage